MLGRLTLSTLFVTLAACGTSAKSPDAAPMHDSSGGADALTGVQTVACPTTPDATVTASDPGTFAYSMASTSITVGQVVKFVMASDHNVVPDTGGDPGVHVDFAGSVCKKFTVAGTFKFHCSLHLFEGMVVVN